MTTETCCKQSMRFEVSLITSEHNQISCLCCCDLKQMTFADMQRFGRRTCPLPLPGVRVRFCGFHPGEREVISALFPRVSIACSGGERLLLERLMMVELRHTWILPHGQSVRGGSVRKAGLLQGSHGRRSVDGVDLPAHVEAGRRAVAVVLPL